MHGLNIKYKHQYYPDDMTCGFSSINTICFSNITIEGAVKAGSYDEEMSNLDSLLAPDAALLAEIESELRDETDPFNTYRGKNELFCFTRFLNCLRDEYNRQNRNYISTLFSNKMLEGWMAIHENELKANWKLLSEGEGFFKIDPLR